MNYIFKNKNINFHMKKYLNGLETKECTFDKINIESKKESDSLEKVKILSELLKYKIIDRVKAIYMDRECSINKAFEIKNKIDKEMQDLK